MIITHEWSASASPVRRNNTGCAIGMDWCNAVQVVAWSRRLAKALWDMLVSKEIRTLWHSINFRSVDVFVYAHYTCITNVIESCAIEMITTQNTKLSTLLHPQENAVFHVHTAHLAFSRYVRHTALQASTWRMQQSSMLLINDHVLSKSRAIAWFLNTWQLSLMRVYAFALTMKWNVSPVSWNARDMRILICHLAFSDQQIHTQSV